VVNILFASGPDISSISTTKDKSDSQIHKLFRRATFTFSYHVFSFLDMF